MTLPLAITMGEPAGIGPDIIIAAWRRRAVEEVELGSTRQRGLPRGIAMPKNSRITKRPDKVLPLRPPSFIHRSSVGPLVCFEEDLLRKGRRGPVAGEPRTPRGPQSVGRGRAFEARDSKRGRA